MGQASRQRQAATLIGSESMAAIIAADAASANVPTSISSTPRPGEITPEVYCSCACRSARDE